MRRLLIASVISGALALSAGSAFARVNPEDQGQPNLECEDYPSAPPGFATQGFANAEEHYAGNGASADHAQSEHAVSQYDVACFEVSQK